MQINTTHVVAHSTQLSKAKLPFKKHADDRDEQNHRVLLLNSKVLEYTVFPFLAAYNFSSSI